MTPPPTQDRLLQFPIRFTQPIVRRQPYRQAFGSATLPIMGELQELIRTERLALVDFLTTLEPAEWATPSHCGEWSVQEVAAHLAWAPVAPLTEGVGGLVRAGFRVNKASAETAKGWARRGPDAIVEQLHDNAERHAKPTGVPEPLALVDAVVHTLDIRLPLGKPRPVPAEAFRAAANSSVQLRWPLTMAVGGSARKRLAGVRLVATGYDWSYGDGAEVEALGDCVLRLLNGRWVDRSELAGPGADLLFGRINRGSRPPSHP
jgi:uncharacterized protein (TIGR03083 family)